MAGTVDAQESINCIQSSPTNQIDGTKSMSCLTPVLNDIASLVSLRAESFDYHIVFIFTDGQISDIESAMQVSPG